MLSFGVLYLHRYGQPVLSVRKKTPTMTGSLAPGFLTLSTLGVEDDNRRIVKCC